MAKVVGTGKSGQVEIYGLDSEKDSYKTGIDTGSVFIAVDSGNIYMYYEEFDADGKPMQGRWYPW